MRAYFSLESCPCRGSMAGSRHSLQRPAGVQQHKAFQPSAETGVADRRALLRHGAWHLAVPLSPPPILPPSHGSLLSLFELHRALASPRGSPSPDTSAPVTRAGGKMMCNVERARPGGARCCTAPVPNRGRPLARRARYGIHVQEMLNSCKGRVEIISFLNRTLQHLTESS